MRSLPRVFRTFEELERAELSGVGLDLDVDGLLDEMFADELDIEFASRRCGWNSAAPCAPVPDHGLPTRTQ
ncbi:MAG: hypothetical protein RMK29_09500 [Myxococcales bacterium]|nr:hypothetical protein [Myxococcota bacterium]MDW8281935.1 hypothetical protein [Myxococcales bacterium]